MPKYSEKAETGEKEPKGAKASDSSGERKSKTPMENETKEKTGMSGEMLPKGAETADHGRPKAHMGKNDGHIGEYNTGREEGKVHYEHKRHG